MDQREKELIKSQRLHCGSITSLLPNAESLFKTKQSVEHLIRCPFSHIGASGEGEIKVTQVLLQQYSMHNMYLASYNATIYLYHF